MKKPPHITPRGMALIVAVCALVAMAIRLLESSAIDDSDNLSLFNPVYMLANYGKLVYPVHGYFDCMVVHPPLHYLSIAGFYLITKNILISRLLPPLVAYLVAITVALRIKTSFSWRFSFLVSLFALAYFGDYYLNTRPTFCLSVYWFTGWFLIESARKNSWNEKYLATGSGLIGIASVMHYYAAFSGVGLLVYAFLISRNRTTAFTVKKYAALLLPAFCIVTVYLLINVIPNHNEVHRAITGAPSSGSILDNMSRHIHVLSIIPVFAFSTLVLLLFRQTRYLAIATLPISLFVYFFVYQKNDYFFHEQLILYFGLCWLSMAIIGSKLARVVSPVIALATFLLFVSAEVKAPIEAAKYSAEEVARACSKSINGNNARIGTRMDTWYVSGADRWLNVLLDLYANDTLSESGFTDYLKQFDVTSETCHMSNNTSNLKNETINTIYLKRGIKLHSFFLQSYISSMNQIYYTAHMEDSVAFKGYLLGTNGTLRYFEQNGKGDYLFLSFVALKSNANNLATTLGQQNTFMLDMPNNEAGHVKQYRADVKNVLVFTVLPFEKWAAVNNSGTPITLIDSIPGSLAFVDRDSLVADFRKNERPIRFYKNLNDWHNERAYYNISSH